MHDIELLKHNRTTAASKCVGLVQGMIANGLVPEYLRELAQEVYGEYMEAMYALNEAFADRSVDPSQYVGDSCGYLAAQCEARRAAKLYPTADQLEAWESLNRTTSTQESF